jgi:hypothetical protein
MRYFYSLIVLFSSVVFGQHKAIYSIETSILRGNVLPHRDDVLNLVNGHPEGLMVSFLVHTNGAKEWERVYNYPDYGGYFLYQDFKSEPLGVCYAAGGLYNFYFLKRHLQLRISQGLAITTNPYNKVTNSINKAFGTRVLDNTNLGLSYDNQDLIKPLGFHAGLMFTHYSNGRFKSPNSGINTYLLNVGLNYNFERHQTLLNDTTAVKKDSPEPLKYNFVLRTGINESPIIRSGQYAFYHLGFYVDKRLGRKSALQLGTDLFLTNSVKEYIRYYSEAYPEKHVAADTDYKRVGLFVGHELFINHISLEAQLGCYVYRKFKQDMPIYDRIGMKYYISNRVYSEFSIKTHMFLAEAVEFGVGVRL